uniref:Uncharacterized protein n=1 Tax=Anopheles culicifacies TaxID=139723 RepID=A0A182MQC3_9DIPT
MSPRTYLLSRPIVTDAIFGTFLLHDERSLAIAQETNLWGAHLRWWRPSNSEHHQYVHHHGRHDREGGQDTQPLSIGKRIPNRPLVDEQCKDYRTEQCRQRNYDRYRVNLIVRKALMGHVCLEEGIDASQASIISILSEPKQQQATLNNEPNRVPKLTRRTQDESASSDI